MQRLLLGLVVTLGLSGGLLSLDFIRGEFLLRESRVLASEKHLSEAGSNSGLARLDVIGNSFSAPSELHRVSALAYGAAAGRSRSAEQRSAHRCSQLSQLGDYIKSNPRDARVLVQWAMLRQDLGEVLCGTELTTGDPLAVARSAATMDRTSPLALFRAGIVLLRGGERVEALNLFNRFVSFGVGVSSQHEQVILSSLANPSDIHLVVPPRFPQVARWSVVLKSKAPDLFESGRHEIAELQLKALSGAVQEFQGGGYPGDLHLKRLLSVLPVTASDQVRLQVDEELSHFFLRRGDEDLSIYFSERATLNEIKIAHGVRLFDYQPARNPFVEWNWSGEVFLDDKASSVGFFIDEPKRVRLVEIKNALDSTGSIDVASVKVFVSKDNQRWQELEARSLLKELRVEGKQTIYLKDAPPDARYWKFHFVGSEANRRFFNSSDDIIRVYG